MRDRQTLLVMLTAVGAALSLAAGTADASDPFAPCDSKATQRPDSYASMRCFYDVAARSGDWDGAANRLERLQRDHPSLHWSTLTLGLVEIGRNRGRAREFFRAAAEGFRRAGNARGEVIARTNLANRLGRAGALKKARAQADRATEIANESGDPELKMRAILAQSEVISQAGSDLTEVYQVLAEAEQLEGVPSALKRYAGHVMGNTAHRLGWYEQAIRHYRTNEVLLQEGQNVLELASVRYNIANSLLEQRLELPVDGSRTEVLGAAQRALEAAQRAGYRTVEGLSRALIARLLQGDAKRQPQATEHLRACIDLATATKETSQRSVCLWYLADLLAASDRAAAERALREASALVDETDDPEEIAFAWRYRTKVRLQTSFNEGVKDGERLLQVIENLRNLQRGSEGRASIFSRWADDYYRLSGTLLKQHQKSPEFTLVAQAFQVAERMRARVLLDQLDRYHSRQGPPQAQALKAQRREYLQSISKTYRQLLDPALMPSVEKRLLRELAQLERADGVLLDRLNALNPTWTKASPKAFVSLSDTQQILREDEALLSFQVGLDEDLFGAFGGGAWLIAVTKTQTRVYSIADRTALEISIPLFAGLFDWRNEREVEPAAVLYRQLLKSAIDELPSRVDRLILIPDGRLHQLPFAALRASPDDPPLAARFALSRAPSATIWANWRRADEPPPNEGVWVFADPLIALGQERGARTRAGNGRIARMQLDALPYARKEARQVARLIGPPSQVLIGVDASESALKSERRQPFAVIHFAAHAVVDDQRPERSAVVLSPGETSEDGLLHPREIVELDLGPALVILSGCRTASGKLIRGEGAMSLARAFFVSGTHAVVASLWPLRDDEAARFFEPFYRRLSEGTRLDEALRYAQQDRAAAGAPTAAWAGLVVLGDGSTIAFPGGVPRRSAWGLFAIGFAAVAAAVVLAWRTLVRGLAKR